MKTSLVILVLIIGGLVVGLARQREIQSLRRQIAESKDKLAPVAALKEQNAQLQSAVVDTNQIGSLRSERNELMKLRAEISQHRADSRSSPEELRLAIQSLRAEAEKEQKRGQLMQAQHEAEEESKKVRVILEQLSWIVRQLSSGQGDKIATSFEELRNKAAAAAQENPPLEHFNMMLAPTNPQSAMFEKFEFVPKSLNPAATKWIMLRERSPRQLPDGRWARAYAFSNGAVEEAVLPDSRFDVWEQLLQRPN